MPTRPVLRLVRETGGGRPVQDAAVSHALLMRVARGEFPDTLRVFRPGRVVAFGRLDVISPGFASALRRAREAEFGAEVRLTGGRAAALHEGVVAFSCTMPHADPVVGIAERFTDVAGLIVAALRRLGIDARVGPVDGEYCHGAYSVNAGGRRKLAGIGQRVVAHAAHVDGMVVAEGSDLTRGILVPVYDSLGIPWDPGTTGSVADEAGAGWDEVEEAFADELASRFQIVEASLDAETLALAERLGPAHRPPPAE